MTVASLLLADLAGSMPADVERVLRRRLRIRARVERAADQRMFAVLSSVRRGELDRASWWLSGWARLELSEKFPVTEGV